MNILAEIIEHKREEVKGFKAARPLDVLKEQARMRKALPGFVDSLSAAPMGLIAEVKHMSPSAGVIRTPFDPEVISRAYEQGGAQAVSVLMDRKYFDGGEKDFLAVRKSVELPLLYKEFVVDPWQVWHAAASGASGVLLIVGALSEADLKALLGVVEEAGLEALVEVHDEAELKVALGSGARCVGVNNRNLKDFTVSLETSLRLREQMPDDVFAIGESGIRTAEDVERLRAGGLQAVLVGEHLLRQDDLEQAVDELMGAVWASS